MSPTVRRGRSARFLIAKLAGAILVIALVFAGGWWAATLFVSPKQREATAIAPSPGPVLASVTRGDLKDSINAQGVIATKSSISLAVTSPTEGAVVTQRLVKVNSAIRSGDAILEANGAPLFYMRGRFPFYRTLNRGDEGPDVLQLQVAIHSTGLAVPETSAFDSDTEWAVKAMYTDLGYKYPGNFPVGSTIVANTETATVTKIPEVGTTLGESAKVVLSYGALVAKAEVSTDVAQSIQTGTPCSIQFADGTGVEGTVSSTSGTSSDGSSAVIAVTISGKPLAAKMINKEVVMEIVTNLVATNALLVPSSAITDSTSGQSFVTKQDSDGSYERVLVEETAQLAGTSAIRPASERALKPGDKVRVH